MSSESRPPRRRTPASRTWLLLWLSAGCADLLGLEPPSSLGREIAGGGEAGDSESAGGPSAGVSAGTEAGAGGAGAASAGEAGKGGGEDVPAAGGDGGRVADAGRAGESGVGGQAGEAGSGEAGVGGEPSSDAGRGGEGAAGAPMSEWPTPGGACSSDGALACRGPESTTRYLCDAGTWIEASACDVSLERCDRRTGACTPIAAACKRPGELQFCDVGNLEAFLCGPDLVTLERVVCAVRCDHGTGCVDLLPDQVLLDRVESTVLEGRLWPEPFIPVCFRGDDPDEAALRAAVRLAVDTTWGRYAGVSFLGWDSCSGETHGVELDFVDDCEGVLDSIPRAGYPGNGQSLPVELCRSYFDSEGTRHPALGDPPDVSLLAFAAQHVFGHVLGREDRYYDPPQRELMARTLDLDEYAQITLSEVDIEILANQYGNKPSRSLLAPNGRCLTLSSGEFTTDACDGSLVQQFQPDASALVHVETDSCVQLDGELVSAETCAGDASREAFVPASVRWLGPKGRCVSVLATPDSHGAPIGMATCEPSWPAAQTFTFEFLSRDTVRIRTTGGSCLRWPEAWALYPVPELGDCDGTRDVFEIRGGGVGRGGQCLYAPSSSIRFYPCADFVDQHFSLSGPFELAGRALALVGTGDDAELVTLPTRVPPRPETIFDYHF